MHADPGPAATTCASTGNCAGLPVEQSITPKSLCHGLHLVCFTGLLCLDTFTLLCRIAANRIMLLTGGYVTMHFRLFYIVSRK